MKADIINQERMIITPNNFTEIYAVKKFLEENKGIPIEKVVEVNDTEVFINEDI